MILRKWPTLRLWILYSPYNIWKITSKPEWYLENNLPTEWGFSIYLKKFQNNQKPEWYLENNHPSEWQFSIHLMIFEK